ncbi:DNA damage response protein WSS1 [Cucumis melo var. makuwa]|uniref:DNA damage response protein WSS1 n=1 Tax=Cucumis melo var. makuwa TaxID=1194695 RepID=A0A5D3C9S9_CUCMM|nr:DNA damage response protein WSS1 [Cucumis melo var. makuwa]
MDVRDLNKVWEIKALKKAGEKEAKDILERIAKQVQPIMRKHKWRVKVLSEFCPKNPALLGLNVGRGIHVKLRLRRPNRDGDFFPFNQVLDTMLHELCHNLHGPHNANFYKLWDELRKECEELVAKGISGTAQGFDLPGRRLGGNVRQPPLSSLRKSSLAAAEGRRRLASLLPSGPNRLGGDSNIMVALSPVQAAAMAAERRLQDDIWCASFQGMPVDEDCCPVDEDCCPHFPSEVAHSSKGVLRSSNNLSKGVDALHQKRSRESERSSNKSSNGHVISDFVDLSKDDAIPGSSANYRAESNKRHKLPDRISFPQSSAEASSIDLSCSSSNLMPRHDGTIHPGELSMWECGNCTLLNPPLAPICELCFSQKPKDSDTRYKFWSCKFCTLENSVKLEKCTACGQWRYSHGQPVSTRGPNLGT